uniref:Lysosome-associated membrane glycoprotein 3-like n=1 Tax=Hippocampus comes TaxID=109280 RepID=A0A3Q2XVS8_HIPCM
MTKLSLNPSITHAPLPSSPVFSFEALSLKHDGKPPVTVSPAEEFFPKSEPDPTVKPTTAPAKPTTAPAKPTPPPANATTDPVPTPTNASIAPAPITSTTVAPPTMTPVKPTPPADLSAGDYRLMKGKAVCLMAHVALQVRLVTPEASGTFIVQPNKTRATGECQENKANLTLVFQEGFITFMFNKKNYLKEEVDLTRLFLFSGHYAATNHSLRAFPAKIGHSYSCRSESVYMGNGLYMDVKDDRMQGFNLTKSNEFGVTDHCVADQPDYSVAIGVGVTLLVLVLVVLAVYLLGRKRRTDGYQSL